MATHLEFHIPGHPLHVIQRGVWRRRCFFSVRDRVEYLLALSDFARELRCAVHAYVLMNNHVHLLVTPERASAVSRMMACASRAHERRSADFGHGAARVWDRFEAWPVYPRRYVLACMRYIELNPVRAGLARHPDAYRWSSYAANALGQASPIVTPHAHYCALGRTADARQSAYRALFGQASIEDRLEWRLWPE